MEFRGREALSGVGTSRSDGGDELVGDAAVVDEALSVDRQDVTAVGEAMASDGDDVRELAVDGGADVRGSVAAVHGVTS